MKYWLVLFQAFVFGGLMQSQNEKPIEILQAYEYIKLAENDPTDTLIERFNGVLKLSIQNNQISPDIKLGAQLALGNLYLNKKIYDLAMRHLISAESVYGLNHSGVIHHWIKTQLGIAYFHRGNYLLAGQKFSEALRTLTTKNNPRLENEIRDYMLRLYNILPTYNLQPSFFEQSFDIKQKLGDRKGAMLVAQKLVQVYMEDRQYAKSQAYAKITIQLAEALNDQEVLIQTKLESVHNLVRQNDFIEAKKIFDFYQRLIPASAFHLQSRLEAALGDYYLAKGDEAKSIEHFNKAIPNRAGPTLEQYVFKRQAEAYRARGLYQKAYEAQEKYSKRLNDSYLSTVMPSVVLMEEQSAKAKLNEEIKYLNAQNQLKDSLFRNQALLATALKEKNSIQQNQLEKEKDLTNSMQREVELQRQYIKNERKLRMLFIGSSLALLIMGGVIYSQYRKQRNKNLIITRQSSENEILMKEIHHRVKNNLQIISSLLDMQSLSIKDPIASEAIKEGKNRVLSMALIHQNLYHDGNIRSIKIDDFILHLANSLFDSYRIESNKIKINADLAPLHLDVDTVVPLGLIVNELITNVLKYAFEGMEKGEVNIKLEKLNNDTLFFQLKDNGKGFPPDWSPESNPSFGYQLIKAFSKKLKAKLKTYNDPGATVEMIIYKFKPA